MKRLPSIVLLLLAACQPAWETPADWKPEGPIDCRASLSKESVGLMEPVDLTVWSYFEGREPPDTTVPPIPAGFAGQVETDKRRHEKGWLLRRVFHLRPTRLGTLTIEPMQLKLGEEETTTPGFDLEVTSILGADDDPRVLEDPAAPFPPEPSLWPYFAIAGGVLLIAGLAWWLRRRARRPRPLPVEVPLPAHAKALRALERLRQAERKTEAQVDAFYVGVSDILRTYLEDRFGLHAPMRSTEEFLVEVETGDRLEVAHRQRLGVFLQQCDLVKFARLYPDVDAHEQTLCVAEEFVQQTRDDVLPAAPELVASSGTGGAA